MTIHQQHDRNDCAAACLASVARYYGRSLSIPHVRVLAGTDSDGTSLGDLRHAARKLGFQAEAVSGDYEGLCRSPLPAVVHLDHPETGAHYVVATRVGRQRVTVLDPADGRRHRWRVEQFRQYWSGVALLLLPGPGFAAAVGSPPPSFFQRLIHLLLPHRRLLIQALILSIFATVFAMAGAFFAGLLTDRILPTGQVGMLHGMGTAFAFALILQVVFSGIRKSLTLATGRRIDDRLLRSYCTHLLQLPRRVFHTMQPGELLSRMGDAVLIRRLANDLVIQSGVPVISLLTVLLIALIQHPALAIWLLLSIAVYSAAYLLSNMLHRTVQRRLLVADAALDAQFTETFSAINTVQRLGIARLSGDRLHARIHESLDAEYTAGRISLWTEEATSLLAQGISLALLWGGGLLVLDGSLSLGRLVAFFTVSGYFSAAAAQLMPLARHIQEVRIAAERLFSLLDIPPGDPAGATRFDPENIFPVVLDGIRFAYERRKVLDGLSLQLEPGTVTLICGASGSGKSTMLSLLLREYKPDAGNIRLGVHPLELVSSDSLHRRISIVPQRIELFDDTLLANICLDRAVDTDRLETLCSELGLLSWIHRLPRQFDTPLGPGGSLLSGGQRQLVALARALYRGPSLLLLDEATSALDPQAASRVHRALLRRKAAGLAILWISHQESSLPLVDRCYQLAGGRLIPYTDRSTQGGNVATTIPDDGVAATPPITEDH